MRGAGVEVAELFAVLTMRELAVVEDVNVFIVLYDTREMSQLILGVIVVCSVLTLLPLVVFTFDFDFPGTILILLEGCSCRDLPEKDCVVLRCCEGGFCGSCQIRDWLSRAQKWLDGGRRREDVVREV